MVDASALRADGEISPWRFESSPRHRFEKENGEVIVIGLKDREGLGVPLFSVVTARLVKSDEDGEPVAIRQGVYFSNLGDGTIIVVGEDGDEIYHCSADVTLVPDKDLFGSLRAFVDKVREANR